jgi:hypothetical protein
MKVCLPLMALLVSALVSFGGIDAQPSASNYLTLLAKWPAADAVTVYEGLPHALFEREVFQKESAREGVFTVASQYFYPAPVTLAADDRKLVTPTMTNLKHFKAYGGAKLCGGFHADYLVRWTKQEKIVAQALVCFGCAETLFLASGQSVKSDMTAAGRTDIHSLLSKYRQSRPARATRPSTATSD